MKVSVCLRTLGWLAIAFSGMANGYDDFCRDKSWPVSRPSLYCQGMIIPVHKTRNFISEQLLCGRGSHTKKRGPVPFDEEEWRDLHNADPEAAKDMLRSLPVPQWEGTVQYDSYLHWSWEECELVTSFECGSEKVCKKIEKKESEDNGEGEEAEECHDEPKTCYMDVVVNESELCSHEKLTYDVRYLRVDKNNDYMDRLANGFDLLPGEHEGITVDNGVGYFRTASMSPRLSVIEPRNDYLINQQSGNSYDYSSLMCRQNSNYHIGFTILPTKRISSRSGNAFSLPESFDGEKIDPLIWQRTKDTNGKWQDNGYPAVLRVQDYSATTMNEFASDTNDFFKNIVVRIQLYDKSVFGWPFARNTIYVEEGKAVAQTLNALSENQKVRRSQLWELMLAANSVDPKKNLYRNYLPWLVYYPARLLFPAEELSYENQLSPGSNYQLRLTVYQKGLSIYHQACEDDPEAWDCRFYGGWGWFNPKRYENGYYSDESLDVDFNTSETVNQRSYWPLFWNTVSAVGNSSLVGLAAYGAFRVLTKR